MPRPRKVANQEIEFESELVENNDISSELISDLEAKKEFDSIVESIAEEIPEPIAQSNVNDAENTRRYRVYEKGVFLAEVNDDTVELQDYLFRNKLQLENYVATLSTTSSGLTLANSGTETAAVTVNFTKINTGIDFGTFAFTTNEFTNNGSGTVAIGVVDGGSY